LPVDSPINETHKAILTSKPINIYLFVILSGIITKIRAAGLLIYLHSLFSLIFYLAYYR